MNFLIGFIGAILCIGLFSGGIYTGLKLYPRLHKQEREELTEEEHKKLVEQQQAFQQLMNYSVEDAYGIGNDSK